ncbi:MAG: YfiR family protein [Ginsengibacter sp.]
MKNLLASGSADCTKFIGHTSARRTCNNVNKIFFIKNNLPVFDVTRKGPAKKLTIPNYKLLLLSLFLSLSISSIKAQQGLSYALHANIIYRFTKYIEWPDNSMAGVFIIGVVGDTPLYDELKDFIANKTVRERKIIVRKMSSSADFYSCNILFISEEKSKSLKKIAEITKGTSILIVSESGGLALKGSCINFILVNDRLKLEINKNNIMERNLNIANELLSLGVMVK